MHCFGGVDEFSLFVKQIKAEIAPSDRVETTNTTLLSELPFFSQIRCFKSAFKDEKTKLLEELIGTEGRLTRLKPEKVMEREALIAENLNKTLKFRAMPRQIYVI